MAISSRSIVPSRRTAGAGICAAARAEPSGQGARPKDAGSMPWMRGEGTSCRFDQVAVNVGDMICSARELVSRSMPLWSAGQKLKSDYNILTVIDKHLVKLNEI
jgi:hypothetical protein